MTAPHARLRLTRRGGLAGVPLQATIDTADLDPAEAARIHAALEAADLDALAARPRPGPGVPDAFSYELDVDRGAATHRLVFGEHEVPESLRGPIDLLRAHARPLRR